LLDELTETRVLRSYQRVPQTEWLAGENRHFINYRRHREDFEHTDAITGFREETKQQAAISHDKREQRATANLADDESWSSSEESYQQKESDMRGDSSARDFVAMVVLQSRGADSRA
jgi:hypothetical protein